MAINVWNLSLVVLEFVALAPLRAQECGRDSAYHAMQARGAEAMGVDQYTSTRPAAL